MNVITDLKILLLGHTGQIGWELERAVAPLGQVIAPDSPRLDLRRPADIRGWITDVAPEIIVNAAAYTMVDKAEAEPKTAMAINGVAPGGIAQAAKKVGAVVIHYSTDYVFDGIKTAPYREDDRTNPINVYGASKLAGEQALQDSGAPFFLFSGQAGSTASAATILCAPFSGLPQNSNSLRLSMTS